MAVDITFEETKARLAAFEEKIVTTEEAIKSGKRHHQKLERFRKQAEPFRTMLQRASVGENNFIDGNYRFIGEEAKDEEEVEQEHTS